MKRRRTSVFLRQQDLLAGLFAVLVPDTPLLLPYERARLLTLFLCCRKRFPDETTNEIVLSLVFQIPNRGLDIVSTFSFLYTGSPKPVRERETRHPCFEAYVPDKVIPWINGVAGSAVLHRVLQTARWYPNDWDVYCPGECVRFYFVAFLENAFRSVRGDGTKRYASAGAETDIVSWYRVGLGAGIRINLVMSRVLSDLETFDIDVCATYSSFPFDVVHVPPALRTKQATMKTRGAMTLKQHGRLEKYLARLSESGIKLTLELLASLRDYGYDEFVKPLENIF